jgi:phospholipid/cholesterol/gamma-HCH transport system permease protein
MQALAAIGRFGGFCGELAVRAVRGPWYLRSVGRHTWGVVAACIVPVTCVVFPFGMVMAVQGLDIFSLFGAHRMLASLISVTVLRELSPVLASVLVAAQAGSAFAAELASMRMKEELEATEVMGVDKLAYHAIPRVLALLIACPLLNVIGSIAGISGGFIVAVFVKGEQAGVFLSELWAFTQPVDIWSGMLKTTVFGLVIGLVATYQGMTATGGAAGVGRAVNDTVVWSVVVFITANYFLTSLFFGTVQG